MAVNERATAQIFLDGKQAEAAIDGLKVKATKLKEAIIEAGKAGDKATMKKLQSELKGVDSAMRTLKKESFDVQKVLDNLSGAPIRDIEKALIKVNAEMKRMDRTDPGFNKKKAEAKALKAELAGVNNEMRVQQSWISRVGDGFNKYFGIVTAGAATFAGAIVGFKKASQAYAEFTDQVANIQKTTGLSKDEVIELDKSLQDLDTRTAQDGLLGLATVAGKLGISAKEDVEGFVKAADKVAVALTEDLGGNIEESINDIGKLTDIFKLKDEFGIEKSILKVGSAINSLGAAGTANEGYIVEFTKRMAGVAPAANVSIDQIMGLGATLDQFGQTSEMSSTTISAVLVDMFKSPGQYAKIAGISIKDFNTLLKTDSNEAFLKFLEGLKANNGGLSEMANKLDGLGLEGKRSISVLGVLSNNTETLRQQQILSSKEFEKGTSLTNEFNIKNETTQAKLEKSRKEMALMTRELGEKLSPTMLISTNGATYFIKVLSALINIFSKHGPEILLVAGAITTYTVALKINTAETKLNMFWTKSASVAQSAWSTIVGVLTGKIKVATAVQRIWNTAMKDNPFGLIAASAMILIGAIVLLTKTLNSETASQKAVNDVQKEAKKSIVEQKIVIEDLIKVAGDHNKSLAERKEAIDKLNQISPEYFGNLSIEKSNIRELTEAGYDYLQSLEKIALVKAAQNRIEQLRIDHANAEIDGTYKQVKWYQQLGNSIKSLGNSSLYISNQVQTSIKNETKAQKEYNEQVKALQDVISKNTIKPVSTIKNTPTQDSSTSPHILTDEEIKAAYEAAQKAIDIAHAKELLKLNQYYADKLELEKEYNARVLAAELALLKAKEKIEKDQLKKLELQSQIIVKQKEFDKAIKEALPVMEKEAKGHKKTNKSLLEKEKLQSLANQKEDEATASLKRMNSEIESQAQLIQDTSNAMSDSIYDLASGGEDALKNAAKNILNFALEQLKLQAELAATGVTIQSLAQPDSIATYGAAGIVRAGVIIALIEAAFAGVEGLVNSSFDSEGKAEGGFANPGGKYDPDGIYHKGEFINAQESVNNPTIRPILNIIDFAQKNGTARSINLPEAMASKGLIPGKGKSSGGFASGTTPSNPDPSQPSQNDSTEVLTAVYKLLAKLEKEGIKASINKYGTNSLSEGLSDIDKFNKKVGKK